MSPKYRFDNMDASENAFFSRQLEAIRPGALEVQFAELKGLSFVPMRAVSPGAQVYTYRSFEAFGKAALQSSLSKTGNRAEIAGTENTSLIRSMASAYAYDIQEIRSAQMAGLDLDVRKARTARRAIAQLHDDVLTLGDGTATYLGLRGLFALSGTLSFTTSTGSGGDTEFETKTPDEVVADLHNLANAIVTNSKEAHSPDTMIMPLSTYNYCATRRMGDGTNQSILDYFKGTSQYVRNIMTSTRLETAASGAKRIVCYQRSPDVLEAIVPVEFEQLPPQWDGYESITHCHGRTGGVVAYYPKAISYADNV
jgi:hypothetical protein